jgi:hypothetical protein
MSCVIVSEGCDLFRCFVLMYTSFFLILLELCVQRRRISLTCDGGDIQVHVELCSCFAGPVGWGGFSVYEFSKCNHHSGRFGIVRSAIHKLVFIDIGWDTDELGWWHFVPLRRRNTEQCEIMWCKLV